MGRLVFPWQAGRGGAVALVVRRAAPALPPTRIAVGFIGCVGAQEPPAASAGRDPGETRSVWLRADRPPDATATAVYDDSGSPAIRCKPLGLFEFSALGANDDALLDGL